MLTGERPASSRPYHPPQADRCEKAAERFSGPLQHVPGAIGTESRPSCTTEETGLRQASPWSNASPRPFRLVLRAAITQPWFETSIATEEDGFAGGALVDRTLSRRNLRNHWLAEFHLASAACSTTTSMFLVPRSDNRGRVYLYHLRDRFGVYDRRSFAQRSRSPQSRLAATHEQLHPAT